MIRKNITFAGIMLILSFQFSCFDRNNYAGISKTIEKETETEMSQLLATTFENVNDTVYLAFRGCELVTTPLIKNFYAENQYLPVWTTTRKPNHDARELMRLFARAAYYGLDTSFYQFTNLKELYYQLSDQKDPELKNKALEYELLMTHNCFKIMSHLKNGLIHPDTALYGRHNVTYPANFSKKLGEFINSGWLTEGILDLQPKTFQYRQLQKGLELFLNHTSLRTDSFFIPDPLSDSLKAYTMASEILAASNYYDPTYRAKDFADFMKNQVANFDFQPTDYQENYYLQPAQDSVFIEALKNFQKSHGLHPDGMIGTNTKNALLINNKEHFEQIAINLERLKWEKHKPARYVYVNLPSYKLRVVDNYLTIKTYNVVVGAQWTKTPLFNSKIEYFITNPRWYVPLSISRNEILPRIKKDSTYLARHSYSVYDENSNPVKNVDWTQIESGNFNLRFQQAAGSGNAMGKIKFYFNSDPYNVLIHDTNDKSKFSKELRAYSHGCIRIAEPVEFGQTILTLDNPQCADSLSFWVGSGQTRKYEFTEQIPLYVRYITCEADSKANITFYYDIYGKDAALKEQLFASR